MCGSFLTQQLDNIFFYRAKPFCPRAMQKEYRQNKFKDIQTEGPLTERVKTFGVKWTPLYVTLPPLVAPLVTICFAICRVKRRYECRWVLNLWARTRTNNDRSNDYARLLGNVSRISRCLTEIHTYKKRQGCWTPGYACTTCQMPSESSRMAVLCSAAPQ